MNTDATPMSYLSLLRSPGVLPPFCAAALIRFAYACLVLSLLLTVEAATSSYATAGSALAACGLATMTGPYKSRMVDRFGTRPVLATLGLGFAFFLCCIAVGAAIGNTSPTFYILMAFAAGLLTPPIGPVMRGIWAALVPDTQARTRAYSLDAITEEGLFAAGPLTIGILIATTRPFVSLLVVAGAATAGTAWLVLTQPNRRRRPAGTAAGAVRSRGLLGPLRISGVGWVAAVMVCVGLGLAPLEVAVAARAAELGTATAAGPLLAAISVGSVIGGFIWGSRQHHHNPTAQLFGLVAAASIGALLAGAAPTLITLGAALTLAGAFVAPIFVVAYSMVDDLVHDTARTEASTWVASAANIGGSAGAISAGFLIEHATAQAALLVGALVLAATLVLLGGVARSNHTGAPS